MLTDLDIAYYYPNFPKKRGVWMVSSRKTLIASISKFLYRQLKDQIKKQLIGKKEEDIKEDIPPVVKHQIGVLHAVCDQAEKIFNHHAIRLMPPKGTPLEDNIIYVEWDGNVLSYQHRNRIEDFSNYTEHEGAITTNDIPQLEEVNLPLKSTDELQSLFINILKILVERGHVSYKEKYNHYGKNADGVLRQLLDEREWLANTWVDRIARIQKNYFKKVFTEEMAQGDESKIDKEAMRKYVRKNIAGMKKFENLYKSIFHLYSCLLRQQFCLQQFAVLDDAERFVQEKTDETLNKIARISKSFNDFGIEEFKEEVSHLVGAFETFKKMFEGEDEVDILPFDSVPDKYKNVNDLIIIFEDELAVLKKAKKALELIRARAKLAADAGDEFVLKKNVRLAKTYIKEIKGAKKKLNSAIDECIHGMHERVGYLNEGHTELSKSIKAQTPNALTLKLLVEIAVAMKNTQPLDDQAQTNEFGRLISLAGNLEDACKAHNGVFTNNGWGTLAEQLKNTIDELGRDIKAYAEKYLDYCDKVKTIAHTLKEVCDTSYEVSYTCGTNEFYFRDDKAKPIPAALASISQEWDRMRKSITTEEYNDILKLPLNGFKAFMRNHWWKMLVIGLVCAVIAAPIAFFVLNASLMIAAVVTTAALIAGIFTGAGIGKLIDKCCKPNLDALEDDELHDDEDQVSLEEVFDVSLSSHSSSPSSSINDSLNSSSVGSRRSSTAILNRLGESVACGDISSLLTLATERARKDLEGLNESRGSSEPSSQPQLPPPSTNPFDEGYSRIGSYNPFSS